MTTKTILLTGLASDATELDIQSWLADFGAVTQVDIIRDGNAALPYVLVQMNIGEVAAAALVSRLSHYWHEGAMVRAWLLHH